jgi:hypothetical protein
MDFSSEQRAEIEAGIERFNERFPENDLGTVQFVAMDQQVGIDALGSDSIEGITIPPWGAEEWGLKPKPGEMTVAVLDENSLSFHETSWIVDHELGHVATYAALQESGTLDVAQLRRDQVHVVVVRSMIHDAADGIIDRALEAEGLPPGGVSDTSYGDVSPMEDIAEAVAMVQGNDRAYFPRSEAVINELNRMMED